MNCCCPFIKCLGSKSTFESCCYRGEVECLWKMGLGSGLRVGFTFFYSKSKLVVFGTLSLAFFCVMFIFFPLLNFSRVTNENYQYIFSHNKERDKKRKKRQVERAKKSATSNGGTAGDRDTSENKTPVNSSDAQPSIFKTQKSLNEILGMEEGEIASF